MLRVFSHIHRKIKNIWRTTVPVERTEKPPGRFTESWSSKLPGEKIASIPEPNTDYQGMICVCSGARHSCFGDIGRIAPKNS